MIDPQPRPGGGRDGGDAPPDFDAFISYAHSDGRDVAAALEVGLRGRGLRVWLDDARMSVGDSILGEIRDGLERSSHMVAVVSPAYLERPPALMELGTALLGRPDRRIFPILHKTRLEDVSGRLSWLADTVMLSWDAIRSGSWTGLPGPPGAGEPARKGIPPNRSTRMCGHRRAQWATR